MDTARRLILGQDCGPSATGRHRQGAEAAEKSRHTFTPTLSLHLSYLSLSLCFFVPLTPLSSRFLIKERRVPVKQTPPPGCQLQHLSMAAFLLFFLFLLSLSLSLTSLSLPLSSPLAVSLPLLFWHLLPRSSVRARAVSPLNDKGIPWCQMDLPPRQPTPPSQNVDLVTALKIKWQNVFVQGGVRSCWECPSH